MGCPALLCLTLLLATPAAPPHAPAQIVRAAPVTGDIVWSPRRLFNAALREEERKNPTRAVQLYMSARLSSRHSLADTLYARGAGLRLVRILAGYDDDAAAAAAVAVAAEAERQGTTDLAPLIRSLLRRLERESDLDVWEGTLASVRFEAASGEALLELQRPDGERRIVAADGPVSPFSAGDDVRLLVRRHDGHARAKWRLVAVGHADGDGWQLLAVSGLPGPGAVQYGALEPR